MTLFGYFICLLYGGSILLLFNTSLRRIFLVCFTICCCLEINNLSGYILTTTSGYEFEYSEFGVGITAIVSVLFLLFNKAYININQKFFLSIIFFIVIIIIGIGLGLIFPTNAKIIDYSLSWDKFFLGIDKMQSVVIGQHSFLIFLRCLIIIIFFITAKYCISKKEDCEKIISCILFSVKIHLLFCLFEWITKNIFNSDISSVIQSFVMNKGLATYSGIYMRGNGIAIQGLTREPSHLSITLYYFLCFNIMSGKLKQNKFWVLLALFIWLNSGSFAGVMYISVLTLLYLANKTKNVSSRKALLSFFMTSIVLVLCIIGLYYIISNNEYLSSRFANVENVITAILNNNPRALKYTSESARLYGAYYTICEVLKTRPLFGLGIGTTYTHSGIACVLGQIGIFGFLAWHNMLNKYVSSNYEENNKFNYFFMLSYILPNILMGGIHMLYVTYLIPLVILCKEKEIASFRNYKETLNVQ